MKERGVDKNLKDGTKSKLILIIVILILFILIASIGIYILRSYQNKQSSNQIIIENPLKKIVDTHLLKNEQVSLEQIVQEGMKDFNVDYINYILLALNVNLLHSFPGFGNPIVELVVDNEIWSSEISGNVLMTKKSSNENRDIRFTISKEETVRALLSQDIKQFMKGSVIDGKTQIEMIAGKPELLAKGYLDLYNALNS
ncbi:MAG: hypothetical protein PHF67_01780 [Candidatus Nanoarchaeia archaeon]|nr:hypothetical protein [Candidatus Nanoarchaeia archaeon]